MQAELSIFVALGAYQNDVSAYGIPTVYYAGDILKSFTGIAMTLFYGTLDKYYNLWKQQRCNCIPYSNILSIFKQMVREYSFEFKSQFILLMFFDFSHSNVGDCIAIFKSYEHSS